MYSHAERYWCPLVCLSHPIVGTCAALSRHSLACQREYRHAYAEALFGFTKKKRGWDCMRHLEILASGTLPIALGALGHACPSAGMLLYPSRILRQVP